MEACDICGFAWESVSDDEVAPRIHAAVTSINDVLRGRPEIIERRPSPDRWSVLEYSGHVRDVLLNVRDRLVVGIVEDDPGFKPIYRDQRVDMGLYAADTGDVVARELEVAAALFERTFAAISPEQLDRPCQYAFPTPRTRTLRWMSQQVVHELEHHRDDIEANLASLTDP